MTSLQVSCGLGPPIKNPGNAYDPNRLYFVTLDRVNFGEGSNETRFERGD